MALHRCLHVCFSWRLLLHLVLIGLWISDAAAQNVAPVLLSAPTNQWVPVTSTAVLSVEAGGTAPLRFQWQFKGADIVNANSATLVITNVQSAKTGEYFVRISNDYGSTSAVVRLTALQVAAWGAGAYGQTIPPAMATNVVAIAAGEQYSLALRADGVVVPWGKQIGFPPRGVTNAIAVAASGAWAVALTNDIFQKPYLFHWGSGSPVGPYHRTNVVAISAGLHHELLLLNNGKVISEGSYHASTGMPPTGQVKAIAAGGYHNLTLLDDGTVTAYGDNSHGQTNVPPGLANVISIAAGKSHSLALKADGHVVAWGSNASGQTNMPGGLQEVVAIAAGYDNSMALTAAGQVYVWGSNSSGQTNVPFGLTNVVALACGAEHCMAFMSETGLDILREPGDQIAGIGETARFTPAVVGTAPLFYQWQREGTNIPGATAPLLVLTNAQFSDEGSYRLIVSNDKASRVSSNYFLNVMDLAEALNTTNLVWKTSGLIQWRATANPLCPDGAGAGLAPTNRPTESRLLTTVTGPGTLSFWWKSWPYPMYLPMQFSVNGFPAPLVRAPTSPDTVTTYLPHGTHVLTWSGGKADGVTLLDRVSFVPGATAPLIFPSSDRVYSAGSAATIGFWSIGTPPLQYQWFFNETAIADGTNDSLVLPNVQKEHAGSYTVLVQNGVGSTNATTHLTVTPAAPNISSPPLSRSALAGFPYRLEVKAQGTEPMRYQWRRDGAAIPGATGTALKFDPVKPDDAATYTVEVSNSEGTVLSPEATLKVYTEAELNASGSTTGIAFTSPADALWHPQTNVTHDGISALASSTNWYERVSLLEASITGPATISFWWKLKAYSSSSLTFRVDGVQLSAAKPDGAWRKQVFLLGAGTHAVNWRMYMGTDGDGAWLDEVTVTQGATPASIVAPPNSRNVSAGSTAHLTVDASGTPPLTYRWKFNGVHIPGETNATLTLKNMQTAHSGTYTAEVDNDYGPEVSASGTVTVTPRAPLVGAAPASMARPVHGSALLELSVFGSEPLSYTWFLNGSVVHTTTVPRLLITDLQRSDAGEYHVKVENQYGSITGAVATLAVHPSVVLDLWATTPASTPRMDDPGDVIAVAAGLHHTSALRSDGTVICWGDNVHGQTEVPAGLSNVVAIAAGDHHNLALLGDGSVVGWGYNSYGQIFSRPDLQPVVAIAAAGTHSLLLQANGTVVPLGYSSYGAASVPAGLSNVVEIWTGRNVSVAVLEDSSIKLWGNSHPLPESITNIVQAVVSSFIGYGLQEDGSIGVWGINEARDTPVRNGGVVSLAGDTSAFLIYTNGTLAHSPFRSVAIPIPPGLTNVVSAAAKYSHAVVLLNDGRPFISRRLLNKTAAAGSRVMFYPGIVGSYPISFQWYHSGNAIAGATNRTLIIDPLPASAEGLYHCVAANPLGTVATAPARLTVTNPGSRLALSADETPSSGQVRLQISGLSGKGPIVIYTSTDLLNWDPVWTNSPASGAIQFLDETTTAGQRFYKVVEQ